MGTVARRGVCRHLIHNGWLLIRDKILFLLPLIVLPAVAIRLFSVPRLSAIQARIPANGDAPLVPKDRRAAADPGLVKAGYRRSADPTDSRGSGRTLARRSGSG